MAEAGAKPRLQLRRRLAGVVLAVAAADQHDLGRREALQLVLDRLDDVLVADPGLGRDPGLGERGHGGDEVLLGALPRALDVGGPAIEEADPRRREDEDLGIVAASRQSSAAAIRCTAAGSSAAQVTTSRTRRGPSRRGRADRSARLLSRRDGQDRKRHQRSGGDTQAGPTTRKAATIGTTIAATISGSFQEAMPGIVPRF